MSGYEIFWTCLSVVVVAVAAIVVLASIMAGGMDDGNDGFGT